VKISIFSQSLFALQLLDAIDAARRAGFSAIELACGGPHLDLETARENAPEIVHRVREAGLEVAGLSLFNCFTDPACIGRELEAACTFIGLAPKFGTGIAKLTPGPPGSAEAEDRHWAFLGEALETLVPVARECKVRLAFETHMRQLTDTLASSMRLLDMTPEETVGLTVDFSNLSFAGESLCDAIPVLGPRILHTHVKNGTVGTDGSWHFGGLDRGLTDYTEVLASLRDTGYDGYLSLECLGDDARDRPLQTIVRDREILEGYLHGLDEETQ